MSFVSRGAASVSSALKWGLAFAGGTIAALLALGLVAQELGVVFTIVLAIFALFAFVIGISVFAATWLFRKGADAVRGLMEVPQQERFDTAAAFQADMTRPQADDELTQAAERIRRIKKAAHGLVDRSLAASLERLAQVAEGLLTQASQNRSAKRKLRRQLVHHLAHVEAVTLNLFRMQDSGAGDPDLARRAAGTFARLADDFEAQRRTAAEGKSLETEARLDLLAQEMGVAHPGPPPVGRSAAPPQSLTPTLDRLFRRPHG
jgi:hypothetical protein